jgi:hypothetical protein
MAARESMPVMKCPTCGLDMEAGFLETESLISGVKWRKEITSMSRIGLGGERLYESNVWGIVHIDAERCPRCRLILHKY